MTDRVGQQLGNYRLVCLLGSGNFGEVYLGEHVYLKTQTAIKVLQMRVTNDNIQAFLAEAQTVARLEHPHIVRIMDFGVKGNTPFLVMSYASNGELRQRHPRGSQLPVSTILTYLDQAADALQYAHDKKLIHRDVKPENMLLGHNNEVLLSDFGIAVVAHSTSSSSVQNMAGTIAYMAPEQIQGKPHLVSDQYSLAVIVYEWLCGSRPFSGTPMEIVTQHLTAPPPPLQEKVPSISPTVEHVVLTALAKDPKKRFPSIRAFANAFEQACHSALSTFSIPTLIVRLPTSAAPQSNLTSPQPRISPTLQRTKEQWLEEGKVHLKAKRHIEALAAYEHATQLDPDNALAYIGKGDAFNELKRHIEALAAYEHAIQLDPDNALAYIGKGDAFNELKRHIEALAAYEHAIQLDPDSALAYIGKGDAFNELKRHIEALAAYEHAIQLDPDNALAYIGKGDALRNIFGRREEALAAYEHAIQLDPDNALAYLGKGDTLLFLRRYEEALSVYGHIIQLDPNNTLAYSSKGFALSELKRYDEAFVACEYAIQLNPNNAQAYTFKRLASKGV